MMPAVASVSVPFAAVLSRIGYLALAPSQFLR
jgi:hypothetical protein